MSSFEELKVTFFDETSELLVQLETGLNEMQSGTENEDTVHAIFRAVHSIKGGAGVFGFSELIAFAHVLETVMEAVRRGSLAVAPDVIDVLLRANDTLADLVGCARDGTIVEDGFGADCRAALERLIGVEENGAAAGAAEPDDIPGLDFTPVRFDDLDGLGEEPRRYALALRPKPEMIRKGLDPLFFFDTLRTMGEFDLVADLDALPPLSEVRSDGAYLGWSGELRTTSPRADIEAVLEPIAADCGLRITDLTPDTVGDEVAALPDEALSVATEPVISAPAVEALAAAAPPLAPAVNAAIAKEPPRAGGGAKDVKTTAATIRVELEKIDRVVNMVGELVIAQAMLGQVIESLPEETDGRIADILADLVRHTRGLKDSVMAIRAQPVSSVFQRMPRLVRELSAKTAKKVQIEMSGENTEVDKTIIERLSDPLTHIIRNSIDHGIEAPAERLARGKSETGTVHLLADQRGGRIIIEISDDGAGINCERVLKKARDRGLVDPNANLTDDEICNLIFLPGFSTAETVSDISGRGVGMDVVRRNIQDLGGRTSIRSEPGRGMTIQLMLPLTLAVMDGMVVEVDRQTYVLPIPNIVECLRPETNEIHNLLGTAGTLRLRGDIVPLVHLGALLGVTGSQPPADASASDAVSGVRGSDHAGGVVVIAEASDGTRLGLLVDELCGHQQVVIKSIEENCGAVEGIAGATILGDGHVAFILDIETLSELVAAPAMAAAGRRVA